MIKIDIAQFWNFVLALVIIAAAVSLLWSAWKKSALEVLKTTADAWKDLAAQKTEEIKSLEKRLTEAESKIHQMEEREQIAKELQASTSSLNMQLQIDLNKLEAKAEHLQRELDIHRMACEPKA